MRARVSRGASAVRFRHARNSIDLQGGGLRRAAGNVEQALVVNECLVRIWLKTKLTSEESENREAEVVLPMLVWKASAELE